MALNKLTSNLPLTTMRIWVAKVIYQILKATRFQLKTTTTRSSINYDLDLNEGIDLSIYLFGSFQRQNIMDDLFEKKKNPVVLDVGANIGSMTLEFAKRGAKVFAFEPTDFAYNKLQRNLSLNPNLHKQVQTFKCFVSDHEEEAQNMNIYSSWSLESNQETHPLHGGVKKEASNIPMITIDNFIERTEDLNDVDFAKIDTEGHELSVMKGMKQTLLNKKPVLLFEVGLYQIQEVGVEFADIIAFLDSVDYQAIEPGSSQVVDMSNYQQYVPKNSTVDLLARPIPN